MLTAAYALRPVLRGFAPAGAPSAAAPAGLFTRTPLVLLAAFSIGGGLLVGPIIRALGAEVPHLPLVPQALAVAVPLMGFALAAWLLPRPAVAAWLAGFARREKRWSVDALILLAIVRPFRRMVQRLVGRARQDGDPVGELLPRILAGLRDALVVPLAHDPLDRLVMAVAAPVASAAAALSRRQAVRPRDQSAGLALALLLLGFALGAALWA